MTSGVVSLRPDMELDDFFTFMWGEQVGFAYAPLKLPNAEEWETHYFKWPEQKSEIVEHVLTNTKDAEVYFGPALYKIAGPPIKENILGSNVLWTELDGNAPRDGILGDKIPQPSMRIRSSLEGHEHLYWKLADFESDVKKIEDVNRAIGYLLQADTSAWDSTQILRPPNTNNHKRNKVVRLLTKSTTDYGYEFFDGLEVPKQLTKENIELADIPDALDVIATKVKWSEEDWAFFRKQEITTGSRSSALMRLAFTCAEMRLSDEEAFAILLNADNRWKKFSGRRDQAKRLLDLINRARHKYPLDVEMISDIDELPVFNWQGLLDLEIHVDWMITGKLQRQGIMLVAGAAGTGKTQFVLQTLIHMAIGKPFLDWQIDHPRKVCFFSMEMGPAELKYLTEQMNEPLTSDEKDLLAQNFDLVPIGNGIMFESEIDRRRIEHVLKTRKPECVAFDSLSTTTMDELSEERTAKRVMDIASQMRQEFDTSIIFIHHNRKAQVHNKKPTGLADVYGSNFITAQATTVLIMWRNLRNNEIDLIWAKVRLAKEPPDMVIMRVHGLQFQEVRATGMMKAAEDKRKEIIDAQNEREQSSGKPGFLSM